MPERLRIDLTGDTQVAALAYGKKTNHTVKLQALRELLSRGWGQPVQAHEISGSDSGPLLTRVIHELHPGPSKGPPGLG